MKFYNYLLTFISTTSVLSYSGIQLNKSTNSIIDWNSYDNCVNNSNIKIRNPDPKCFEITSKVQALEMKCLDKIIKECPIDVHDTTDNICNIYKGEKCQKIANDDIDFIPECVLLSGNNNKKNLTKNRIYQIAFLYPKYFCIKNEDNQYCPVTEEFKVSLDNSDTNDKENDGKIINKIKDVCKSKICTDAFNGYIDELKGINNNSKTPSLYDDALTYLKSDECITAHKNNQTNKSSETIETSETSDASIIKYRTSLLIASSLLYTILF